MSSIQPITCTNHNPICPNCNQGCTQPVAQPAANNYSGVTIDIHNPTVNVPPFKPVYDIPQATIYPEPAKAEEVK